DFEHALEVFPAGELFAADELGLLAPALGADERAEVFMQNIARERALAAPRHAGHHAEALERKSCVDVLQVVHARAGDNDTRVARADAAPRDKRMNERSRQESTGDGGGRAHQLVRRAFGDDMTAAR